LSNLLYLFVISGVLRGVLARRMRELRKPRRSLSAPELEERAPDLEKRDNGAAPATAKRNADE
jgi:hypothetical protein